ncbi:MAG: hypothetical protein PF484_06585 [Bacteroidales bacterium]|nr:hypothetical protein [Bacteroidales bacterium]
MNNSEIKIFQLEDGQTEILVKLENDNVWLTQKQISSLFDKDSDTIGLHSKNIYELNQVIA